MASNRLQTIFAINLRLQRKSFSCDDDEQDSYLQLFTFLCMTIYDIYMKKQVVTGVIDELKRRQDASDERAKAAEKEKREERKRK